MIILLLSKISGKETNLREEYHLLYVGIAPPEVEFDPNPTLRMG